MPNIDAPATLPTLTPTAKRSQKRQHIIDLKTTNPKLSSREIAKLTECSHVNVVNTLKLYGIDNDRMEAYSQHKASILAGIQSRLLSSITDQDITKASMKDRIVSAAILHDKELDIRQPGRDTMPLVTINQVIHVAK